MKSTQSLILDSAISLLEFCRKERWAGSDPYDALNSRLFSDSPFNRSRLCRLALTQLFKRLPMDLRPIFRVPKERNPKGVALFISTLLDLQPQGLVLSGEMEDLADTLESLRSPGQNYACWGYNFPWQARDSFVPRWEPNIICTTFAANALLDLYLVTRQKCHLERAMSAAKFILETLLREEPDGNCWINYTPRSGNVVHNANLLGAAFLARLHSIAPDSYLRNLSLRVAQFSLDRQHPDGSWVYGEDARHQWIDSFHTGYNLVALDVIHRSTGDETLVPKIRLGCDYFASRFITNDGIVAYYHNIRYPIDCHCTAQAIITLLTLPQHFQSPRQTAERVALWAINNMRDRSGVFFYQRHRYYTNRIPYMRWTQAWMLKALALLLAENASP
jgi:hypothetical protein